MIIGLTAGFVYYFIKTKKGKIIKIPVIPSFIILHYLNYTIVLSLYLQSLLGKRGLIYLNWFGIQTTDWIRFIVTNAFLTFIPGFIILNVVDRENKISTMPRIVISVLLSIFLSSQLIYVVELITLDLFFNKYFIYHRKFCTSSNLSFSG